ncbi:response regulator [Larkinella sp. VNQ87]|uniref:response regulator n=1 Tax=Larkinella sp. VNQ87 TaxID=3400921 RepID=UPI003C00F5BB
MMSSSTHVTNPGNLAVRVLIVEDNPMNQTFLAMLLGKYNIPSVVVNNGLEAVNFLKTETVDLVLMDIQMPVMDGLTATQQIREHLGLTLPVVAVTSNPEFDARPRCQQVGMNDFLSKPVQKKQLEAVLERFLGVREVEPSTVDHAYLLEITGGDTDLLTDLLTFFKNDLPTNRAALFQALNDDDRAAFDHLAHRFRSSLNSLAMTGLATDLKQLERNPNLTNAEIRQRLTTLFDQIPGGLKMLDDFLK